MSETNLTGRSLKQYHLVGQLGAGGMGVVYRARDTVLGRDVAVKVLPADKLQREESRHRFHREARAASALNHPNVITIYEIGCVDGIDFIAMEYVSGHTLQSLLRQRRLSVAEAAGYAFQVADALAKAHAAGVVHRDLKPGNLVITDDGLVKILDFGLARLNDAARDGSDDTPTNTMFATRDGTVLGTVAYMSPEQARGEEAGPQSDIFSLGIVLFEMLSGQMPFTGSSELARLHSLNFTTPKDVRALSPDVPEGLARIVARMLVRDLAVRYAAMTDVRRDLRPFAAAVEIVVAGEPIASAGGAVASTPSGPSAAQPAVDWTARWRARRGARKRLRSRARRMFLGAITVASIASVASLGRLAWSTFRASSVPPAALGDALDVENATPYDLYVRARQLLDRFDRENNPAQAIVLLERAVEKDNQYALAYATLTEAYRYRYRVAPDQQWLNLMTQSAQRAILLNPELGAAHTAMGLVRMEERGKASEAETHFQRAIDLDPRNPTPQLWMATLLATVGRTDESSKHLQSALTLEPGNWAALLQEGLLHYRAARFVDAVAAWERARNASPDNVRVLSNLAAAYHMLDRYEDAASTLQRAIEIEPAARHYNNLGTLRFFQGKYDEAVAPLEKAVGLFPTQYLYWGNLADAYRWSLGHKAKAREKYVRAIQMVREQLAQKPEDRDLRSTLALYLAKSGDKAGALEEISQVVRTNPAAAAVLFRLAVTYEIAGNRDDALRMLERALKAGYAAREIRSDPELLELRNDVRYHNLVAAVPASSAR